VVGSDKFVGSFPKVGIVIPNPVAWLIPEVSDLAHNLQTTLDVPVPGDGAPLGSRIAPTSDGFVIWLPSTGKVHMVLVEMQKASPVEHGTWV
jgi:hypothetical protein